ncbi:MAG: molybdenum cofactor biosynthesis protein MoaE [Halobacteriovoraceae bacterium]|jgi:molybdopterin synthase catalytic subunit|nr:molybdenum cofactor biosynthesis protein MoaE [Halobacteriovoraceae bacterium]MBT5096059.1 molybdenum cofactor biosynthesis protein MoaE [Halobacteriovoraceae bacterium]
MFTIAEEPIDIAAIRQKAGDDSVGGIAIFEGVVRNHNEGHGVQSLEYQAYSEMAEREGQVIMQETLEKFDIVTAFCQHRIGHLKIREMAVYIYVGSKHRREAFEACQYIINEVKKRVPIWKKEHYLKKPAEWVACHGCSHPH